MSKAREQAEAVQVREVQTNSLYHLSRDLAATADIETLLAALLNNLGESLHARVAVLLPEGGAAAGCGCKQGHSPEQQGTGRG
ncbi:MAG: hypothetical protein AB9919_06665 [Geobacteraceae bacterium]